MTTQPLFLRPGSVSAPTPPIGGNAAYGSAPGPGRAQVLDRCRCTRSRHRTYRKFAQCSIAKSWVRGEGAWAIVLRCGDYGPHVVLVDDEEVARRSMEELDRQGCARTCQRQHRLVVLGVTIP